MTERPPFDPSELAMDGFYQSCIPAPGSPKLNSPISAGENAMLMFNGEKPLWYPSMGMIGGDYKPFRPARWFPDLWAAHDFMCGEPPVNWDEVPLVQESWFGVQQQFEPGAGGTGGAMPVPGSQAIDDMNDWEKLPWPSLDDIDWEGCTQANEAYLFESDVPVEFCIPTLYWERMMSIMTVSDAAVALIDPDQQDAVHAFFDKLTDFYEDYLERVHHYFKPALILAHDDWGHQNGLFFSKETHTEMILPYFKRFVDKVHELGMRFELHSCGKGQDLVPNMIEAGVDLWLPQPMNDVLALAQQYKGQGITFGVYVPPMPRDTPEEVVKKNAEDFAATYGDLPVAFCDMTRNAGFYIALYAIARQMFA